MNYLYDLWDDFISLLFPRICYGCGSQLLRNERIICTECYVLIPRTDFHLTQGNPVEQLFWGRCRLERAAAFSYYTRDSRIRRLIDVIIPVPLHPSKQRQRGFNQSDLIAEGLSQATGIPFDTGILERRTVTKTQTRKSRYDRWTNVCDIFRVRDHSWLEGKHVLLVDDVITTGSTIEACASELLSTENVMVSAIALAYAVM